MSVTAAANDVVLWCTWGDNAGFQVFAEAVSYGLRIIFRFRTDPTLLTSVQSQVVYFYYVNGVQDSPQAHETALWSIKQVWSSCANHHCITSPDVVVDIYQDKSAVVQWRLCHLSIYEKYLQQLQPLREVLSENIFSTNVEDFLTVDIADIVYHKGLPGRSNKTLVGTRSCPDPTYVFKALDFMKYLKNDPIFRYRRDACYHEIRTIRSLHSFERFKNIVSSEMIFVTTGELSLDLKQLHVCGVLYPYMRHGSLNDEIKKAIVGNYRLASADLARWCFQMARAVQYVHYRLQSFHMDIRPSKFLIDNARDLVLSDWEQSGASPCTIAPEADGSYNAELVYCGFEAKIVHTPYQGPERQNNFLSWPSWNVFPFWREECPQALEAAEVYSLGRTMWMLLEHVGERDPNVKVPMCWSIAYDLSMVWRAAVERCLHEDPNKRHGLEELVNIWDSERSKDWDRNKFFFKRYLG